MIDVRKWNKSVMEKYVKALHKLKEKGDTRPDCMTRYHEMELFINNFVRKEIERVSNVYCDNEIDEKAKEYACDAIDFVLEISESGSYVNEIDADTLEESKAIAEKVEDYLSMALIEYELDVYQTYHFTGEYEYDENGKPIKPITELEDTYTIDLYVFGAYMNYYYGFYEGGDEYVYPENPSCKNCKLYNKCKDRERVVM